MGAYEGDKNQKPIKAIRMRLVVSSLIGRVGKALGNATRNCIRSATEQRGCSGG